MKNSEKNLVVIENFILHLTHCGDEKDMGFQDPQTYTPKELYRVAYDYIEEDHVDGKGAEDDYEIVNKEAALVAAYIVRQDLLNGTFFSTYDKALKIGHQFTYKYPSNTKWGENNLEWDETVEKFVKDNYLI